MNHSEKARGESPEDNFEVSLQDILEKRIPIERLSIEERHALVEKAEGMMLEADPVIKPKYRKLIQQLRLSCMEIDEDSTIRDSRIVVSNEYRIRTKEINLILQSRVNTISNYSDLDMLGTHFDELNLVQSS